ncbi:MAG: hypothetical protein GWP08_11500 [Nitrospiraceae bacterium]|nr:hypothetical protein [Nitrospiraceae bacterium]
MKAFYCVGTHWDREWYEPFQEFRMWLVELIDDLIDLLEREPKYLCFHLDGQAVMLQDYLEIRPEKRERLIALLQQRRLIAGPWYDLPDEWLVSGESFIRNLMMGMRACRDMGFEPMMFGYTPDQFGHIAALPMIMNGFGMKAGICWRGTQDENYPAHFNWVAPDGSRMPTHKLMDAGSYAPFNFLARTPIKKEDLSDESVKEHFESYLKSETARSDTPLVLMLDAIDHDVPDPQTLTIFDKLVEQYPGIEFVWGSLEDYADEMLKHAGAFPERTGELREPLRVPGRAGQYLIVHTISSRYPIKQRNDQSQALLERSAEPLALFSLMRGGTPILSYLDKAWEYLLRNHPHDSICGCSIDQVHRDMVYRFDQADLIADGFIRRAVASLGNADIADGALQNVVVHNTLPFRRTGVTELAIPFPTDWATNYIDGLATGERINKFNLVAPGGERIPFQLSAIVHGTSHKALKPDGRTTPRGADLYHLAVELDLPPCGMTGFRVETTHEATRNFGTLMTGPMSASNGEITLEVNPDGTVMLSGEFVGHQYGDLFQYEDCGDAGDGWTYGKLVNDIVYRGPGTHVMTAIEEDGPLRTVFRIEREFDLPSKMDRKTKWRDENRSTLRLTDRLYVEKDLPCLRVRTRIENPSMDHRFRALFPTHVATDTSFADTPFAVVQRDIPIPPETATWQERISPEKAFTSFFGVQDDQELGGLAILAPFGLHEYEVLQTPDRSLALTLFRSTWQTVHTNGEPDGELLGELEFEYYLWPFLGEFDPTVAARLVAQAQTPVYAHGAAELPAEYSFIHLEECSAIVTAIKPAACGEGGVIRLWNPADKPATDSIVTACDVKSAYLCDLNEQELKPVRLDEKGHIPVSVPAGGIASIHFTW